MNFREDAHSGSLPSPQQYLAPRAGILSTSSLGFAQRKGLTPPTYFTRHVRDLREATIEWPSYVRELPKPKGAAARSGARLEKQVIKKLGGDPNLARRVVSGLTFSFRERDGKPRWAIPDLLAFSSNWQHLLVIEVKLSHSADAWFQLNSFYLPIVRLAFPRFHVSGLEICKNYNPDVKLQQDVAFVDNVDDAFNIRECFHPVLIWR